MQKPVRSGFSVDCTTARCTGKGPAPTPWHHTRTFYEQHADCTTQPEIELFEHAGGETELEAAVIVAVSQHLLP